VRTFPQSHVRWLCNISIFKLGFSNSCFCLELGLKSIDFLHGDFSKVDGYISEGGSNTTGKQSIVVHLDQQLIDFLGLSLGGFHLVATQLSDLQQDVQNLMVAR